MIIGFVLLHITVQTYSTVTE